MQSLGIRFLRERDEDGTIQINLADDQSCREVTVTTTISREHDVEIIKSKSIEGDEDHFWKELFICGYGIHRSGGGSESYTEYRRLEALLTLFDYYYPLQNIELILLRQDENLQERILQMLLEILMLDEKPWKFKLTQKGIRVIFDGTEVMLDEMGDGYSGTATWLIDFLGWQIYADRLSNKAGLRDLSGIVLLDEIELTLHPSLQRYILMEFRKHFPKVQLITTSHSPLIAAGAADFPDSQLLAFKLENDQAKVVDKIPSLQGMSVDQVLSSVAFGLYATVSVKSVDDIRRFSELMSKKRTEEEEEEYLTLTKNLEEKAQTGTTEADRLIEKAIIETLENMLGSKPAKELDLLMREKLRRLFRSSGQS
jgi:hypothetical protein